MDFKNSQTKDNLMRAFAGESQARNRYTFAGGLAAKKGHHMLADVFYFTANQEKEHAEIFYNHLKELTGETIVIDGGYPVDTYDDVLSLLKSARHNEYEEYEDVYQNFGAIAKEEGFDQASGAFDMIAKVEAVHGRRFALLAELLGKNQYFENPDGGEWMCMNCGHIQKGKMAPPVCPSCHYDRGYFIPVELAPYLMPELI